jgi:hypothetical protein
MLEFNACVAGFEKAPDQNPLQYIMKIGGDMGVMKKTAGGRRAAALSPEDLADLCRSLNKIPTNNSNANAGHGSPSKANKSSSGRVIGGADGDDDVDDDFSTHGIAASAVADNQQQHANAQLKSNQGYIFGSGSKKNKGNKGSGMTEMSNAITSKRARISIGPITRVLTSRGYHQLFHDVRFFLCTSESICFVALY